MQPPYHKNLQKITKSRATILTMKIRDNRYKFARKFARCTQVSTRQKVTRTYPSHAVHRYSWLRSAMDKKVKTFLSFRERIYIHMDRWICTYAETRINFARLRGGSLAERNEPFRWDSRRRLKSLRSRAKNQARASGWLGAESRLGKFQLLARRRNIGQHKYHIDRPVNRDSL